MHGDGGDQLKSRLQEQEAMRQQHRPQPRHPIQQQRPNYPTTIQFTPSQDDHHIQFDDLTLNLNEVSLEDTFGFEGNDKKDDLFERLYTGNDDIGNEEEDGGTLQSSIELNPYTAKDFGAELNPPKQKKQINQNTHNEAATKSMQRGRDSIFRSHSNEPSQTAPAPAQTSYEKKINENMKLLSPTVAMDRRRSSSKPRAKPQPSSIISPNSSFFTKADPLQCAPLQCTNTSTSLRRNNTGKSSRSRNRSTSRSHRSRSRGTSQVRRSRSRSTSIAPSKKVEDYHQNLFRGAKLIREQLLRSMASADQAMDEAEREFMEEMIERGGRPGRPARQNRQEKNDGHDNGDIDFDYSFDHGEAGGTKTGFAPSPSKGSGVRIAPSQDSSALETESRRLDNLMSIFVANSSASSSNAGLEMKRSSSDKENGLETRPNIDCQVAEVNASHVISPTSSLGLISPTSQLVSPMQNSQIYNEYAGRYFEEDAPKPIVTSPPLESAPIPTKNSVAHTDHHEHRRQKHQPEQVDEALAHAQRAGPLWRSLVGNHVRFPSKWDTLLSPTSPPIHRLNHRWSKWFYVARHRVKGDRRLNGREFGVRSRRSGGRVLMRLLVREMHSQQVCREIAIGCFHPNSKGVRKGDPLPEAEDVREVWMAVRWSTEADDNKPTLDLRKEGYDYEGVVDNFLMQKRRILDYGSMGSALGHRKAVNNENVRAIFGDQPPMTTVDLHEDEIAEILKTNGAKKFAALPALMLLKLFLFSK